MDSVVSDTLEDDIKNLIEIGITQQNQELFFENLNILALNPLFPFSLIKIISNEENSIPLRIYCVSLLRQNLFRIDNEMVKDFCSEADENLFYALQIPYSNLVEEIAILLSEIYSEFHRRYQSIIIFPYLNDKLTESIQNPDFISNSLIFAIDFALQGYILNDQFVSHLPNLVIGEHSENTIQLASILWIHSNFFEEAIIPIIFDNLDELSENALKYTCILIGKILLHDRPDGLIEFIIHCIENESDIVVYSAVESIQDNGMISYNEELLNCLFNKLCNDSNLIESNVSTLCLKYLKTLYGRYHIRAHAFLQSKINESFESGDDELICCAIRCFSFIKFEQIDSENETISSEINKEELESCLLNLSNYLDSELFCCDAAYSLTKITKKYPEYFPRTFESVFEVLSSDSPEVRIQILIFLTNMTIKINSKLSEDIQNQIESEPFLTVLIQMIQSDELDLTEFTELLRLTASFCNVVQTFETENFNSLVELTLEILNDNSNFAVECFHIFSSLVDKDKDSFPQLFETVGAVAWTYLVEQSGDTYIVKYCMNFFSKAIQCAFNFECLTEELNKNFEDVSEFALNCINPFLSSLSIQKDGWFFFYQLIQFDFELFDHISSEIIQFLVYYKPESGDDELPTISMKCKFIIVFIDRYHESIGDDLKRKLINVSLSGTRVQDWNGNIDRQVCMLCYLRLAAITDGIELDMDVVDDVTSLIEEEDKDRLIKDYKLFDEIVECMKVLVIGEEEEEEAEAGN